MSGWKMETQKTEQEPVQVDRTLPQKEVADNLKSRVDHYTEVIEKGEKTRKKLKIGLWLVLTAMVVLIGIYVLEHLL